MKIAIVKLSALGDIVHAMVALQFIKAALPQAQIDWVVEQSFAGVLENNPHIRQLLTVNLKALKTDKRLFFRQLASIKHYRQQHYDLVVDAQGLIKSAIVARLLGSSTVGFDQYSIREKWAAKFYSQTIACAYDTNIIERNLAVLTQPFGIQVDRALLLGKRPFLYYQPPQIPIDEYFKAGMANVLLVIGSSWPSKNYPKQHYLQVVKALNANCVICWGSELERSSALWIAQSSAAIVLPRLSLNDLKAVVAKADLIIGNDTGPTHMAWALNRPSITLFGPTPVRNTYQTDINKVLKSPSVVNPFKLNKNDFSIAEIPPQDIIDLANSLLAYG